MSWTTSADAANVTACCIECTCTTGSCNGPSVIYSDNTGSSWTTQTIPIYPGHSAASFPEEEEKPRPKKTRPEYLMGLPEYAGPTRKKRHKKSRRRHKGRDPRNRRARIAR